MLAVILQTSAIFCSNFPADPQIHEQMDIIQRKFSNFERNKDKSSLNIEVQINLIHNLFEFAIKQTYE